MPEVNHLQLEGRTALATYFSKDRFVFTDIQHAGNRLALGQDLNLTDEDGLDARAEAIFRGEALGAEWAVILVPLNCGQQPYDVVYVTDDRVGVFQKLYRVAGIANHADFREGVYQQQLILESV